MRSAFTRRIMAAVICVAFVAVQAVAQRGKEPLAKVSIYPLGEDGLAIGAIHVEHFTDRNGFDFSARFQELNGINIPWGTYHYVLRYHDSQGGVAMEGQASVWDADAFIGNARSSVESNDSQVTHSTTPFSA